MSAVDRDAFLARVAEGVRAAGLPEAPGVPESPPQSPERDLVELFRARAQTVNAVVHGPMPRHSVPRSVVGVAAGHDISSFATWADLPAPGVAGALSAEGYHRVEEDAGSIEQFRRNPFATVDFGVTGATAGLAESGSVVLRHHSGRSRLISALPPVHVALLRVDALFGNLASWAHAHPDSPVGTSNLVIVTGPSRTGDIEQNLNLGVHGPKHVHVVLIR